MGSSHGRNTQPPMTVTVGSSVDILTHDRGWRRGTVRAIDRRVAHVQVIASNVASTYALDLRTHGRCLAPVGSHTATGARRPFFNRLQLCMGNQQALLAGPVPVSTRTRGPLRLSMSESNIFRTSHPEIACTPTPIMKRRAGERVIALGSCVDVWHIDHAGVADSHGRYLPARVIEIAGELVRLQVLVPPPTVALVDAIVAFVKMNALSESSFDDFSGGAAAAGVTAVPPTTSTTTTRSTGVAVSQTHVRTDSEGAHQGGESSAGTPGKCSTCSADRSSLPGALHFEELWLTVEECRLRVSAPAGGRTGIPGYVLAGFWPALPDTDPAAIALGGDSAAAAAGASVLSESTPASIAVARTLPAGWFPSSAVGTAAATTAPTTSTSSYSQSTFLAALQCGVALDARQENGTWCPAVVVNCLVDDPHLRGGDSIGRGGGPLLPSLVAVDVCYVDTGRVERIPISVSHARLAPPNTHSGTPLHALSPGTFADVAVLLRDPRNNRYTTRWRCAEVTAVRGEHVLMRYFPIRAMADQEAKMRAAASGAAAISKAASCLGRRDTVVSESGATGLLGSAELNLEGPVEEWVDMRAQGYRVREQGLVTGIDAQEERLQSSDEARFEAALREDGWDVFHIAKDGNCVFGSVAHQVFGDASRHAHVRKLVVEYMRKSPEFFGAMAQAEGPGTDLETYLAKMSKPSTWAGWPELVAIEELCDRRIELFDSDSFALLGGPRVQPRSIHFAGELPLEELMGVTPLRLSFHGNSHYNSVQPSESKEVELLGTRGSGDTDPVSPPLGMRTTGVIRAARMRRIAGAAVEEVTRMRAAAASADRGLRDSLIRHHVRVLSGGGVREAQQLQIGAATPGSRKSWYA